MSVELLNYVKGRGVKPKWYIKGERHGANPSCTAGTP